MRLALEELCKALGQTGDLNAMIGSLVREKGLRPQVQKALDVVRVTGNNAIHPGMIDPQDGRDQAVALFSLVNGIVEELITRPKQLDSLYDGLPETVRAQIDNRDKQP